MMWRAPSSASSTESTFLSALTKVAAYSGSGVLPGSWSQRYCASGSRPFSRAIDALVRRFGLYGRYRSSSSVFSSDGLDARPQLRRELALRLDGLQHGLAAIFQLAEICELLLDVADLHFVEIAGDLFAIAGDEGHGGALVEEFDRGGQALETDIKLLRDIKEYSSG